jgi:hypothetical protein
MEKTLNKKAFINQAVKDQLVEKFLVATTTTTNANATATNANANTYSTEDSALIPGMFYAKNHTANLWRSEGEWDASPLPPPNPYMKSPYVEPPLKTKNPELIDIVDAYEEEFLMPADENDIDIIRKSFIIERVSELMRINAVAIDMQNRKANEINMIKCYGEPLGCYAYHTAHDSYLVNCVCWIDLGTIAVAYRAQTQGSHNSGNLIALPDELVEKYLPPAQKKKLKVFREKYKEPQYSIQFMQAIGC